MLDKIKGALYGLAIGDALGGTTEFMTPEEIREQYGYIKEIIGGGVWDLQPGETTDDTAMTICVAKGILENPLNPIENIGKYFLEWEDSVPKDIGVTVQTSFYYYHQFKDWNKAAIQTKLKLKTVSGNGALMRALPVTLIYKDGNLSNKIMIQQAQMTHYDSLSNEACLIYNAIGRRILNGENLKLAIKKEISSSKTYHSVLYNKPDCNPTGFVVNTFKWVLYTLLNTDSFEETVQYLANQGYDSDTTAAIAGGLSGLYYGFNKLPKNYVDKILLKDELNHLAIQIYQLRKKL